MIRQDEKRWAPRGDVPRRWQAHDLGGGGRLLRQYPTPGNEIDGDYPPTVEVAADEWAGLVDGLDNWQDSDLFQGRVDGLVWP